jgi:hypothetical protein
MRSFRSRCGKLQLGSVEGGGGGEAGMQLTPVALRVIVFEIPQLF